MPRLLTLLPILLLASCITSEPPAPPAAWSGSRTYTEDANPPTLRAELTFDGRGNVSGTIDPIGSAAPGTYVKGVVVGDSITVSEQSFSNGELLTKKNTYRISPNGKTVSINGVDFRRD